MVLFLEMKVVSVLGPWFVYGGLVCSFVWFVCGVCSWFVFVVLAWSLVCVWAAESGQLKARLCNWSCLWK